MSFTYEAGQWLLIKPNKKSCMVLIIDSSIIFFSQVYVLSWQEVPTIVAITAGSICKPAPLSLSSPVTLKPLLREVCSAQFLIHFTRAAGVNNLKRLLFFFFQNYFCNYRCLLWAVEYVFFTQNYRGFCTRSPCT